MVAVPPMLALEIEFDPPLPEDRAALYRAYAGGSETKTLLVYDEPFWRDDGFSGQTAAPGSAAEVTLDASPVSGRPGVIASFSFGPMAEQMHAMDGAERRKAVVDAMAARLGPRAADPVDVVETAWWTEEWSRGCSFAYLPPGMHHPARPARARAVRPRALGRDRDGHRLPWGHRRRRALG